MLSAFGSTVFGLGGTSPFWLGGTSSIGALSGVYYMIKVSLAIALAARSGRAS